MGHCVERYHDISAGHRVYGHESKCAHLHGHNYRFTFTCEPVAGLDGVGRVIDFAVIKEKLCMWLEENWDHRMLIWSRDPLYSAVFVQDPEGVVMVPFNPTAENMAEYMVMTVGLRLLKGTGVMLRACRVEETRKCSATFTRTGDAWDDERVLA